MRPTARLHIPSAHIIETKKKTKTIGALAERIQPLLVLIVLPLFLFGEGTLLPLGIALLVVLWAYVGATTGAWGRWSPATISLLMLLAMVPVTFLVTIAPDLTRQQLGYLCASLVTFYCIFTWARSADRIRYCAYVFTATGVAICLPVLLSSAPGTTPAPIDSFPFPVVTETIQKNVLGGTVAMLIPLSVSLTLAHLRKRRSWRLGLTMTAVAVMLCGLALSQSRGAWVATMVALLTVLVLGIKRRGLLFVGAVVILSLLALPFIPLTMFSSLLRGDSIGDLSIRMEIWSRATQALSGFPLTGIGLGTFREVIPSLYPLVISDPQKVHHAHNLYLQIGVDLGLPGLVSFLTLAIFLFFAGTQGLRYWRASENTDLSWITIGCTAALIAMLTHGLVDAVTWGTKPSCLAWAILGLLLACGTPQTQLHHSQNIV